MDWISEHAWVAWLVLALLLAAFEAATVDFVFIMFAGGALAGALAAGFGASFPVQVIVAVAAGLVLVFTVRPIIKRRLLATTPDPKLGPAGLIGKPVLVVEAVDAHNGRVKLAGELWSARVNPGAEPLPVGSTATVLGFEGATALVGASAPATH